MQGRDFQDIEQLEQFMHTMKWETVSLTPDQREVQTIDQAITPEWTQILEAEREETFENEVLEPLYTKTISELNELLEISQGDIVENARESIQTFDLDIKEIMKEVETIDINLEITLDHDDFGR